MRPRGGFSFTFGPHVKSEASRAATYNKRKKGLLKKVKELSILCGVECAVMCHHPQMAGSPPLLWGYPNLDSVLNRFKGVAPEERQKRKLDNTGLLHNHLQKLYEDLNKVSQENQGKAMVRMTPWDERLQDYSATDLYKIADEVLRKKHEVEALLASVSTVAAGVSHNDCTELMQGYSVSQRDPLAYEPVIQTPGGPSLKFMLQAPHEAPLHNEVEQGQDLLPFHCSGNMAMLAAPAEVESGGSEESFSSDTEGQNAGPVTPAADSEYQAIFAATDGLGGMAPADLPLPSAFTSMSSFNFDSIMQGRNLEWWEVGTPLLVPHVT